MNRNKMIGLRLCSTVPVCLSFLSRRIKINKIAFLFFFFNRPQADGGWLAGKRDREGGKGEERDREDGKGEERISFSSESRMLSEHTPLQIKLAKCQVSQGPTLPQIETTPYSLFLLVSSFLHSKPISPWMHKKKVVVQCPADDADAPGDIWSCSFSLGQTLDELVTPSQCQACCCFNKCPSAFMRTHRAKKVRPVGVSPSTLHCRCSP